MIPYRYKVRNLEGVKQMKKSILLFTFAIAFMFFGCSEKSVTHSEPKEKSIEQSFADDLNSLNACTAVYCLQRKRIYEH